MVSSDNAAPALLLFFVTASLYTDSVHGFHSCSTTRSSE